LYARVSKVAAASTAVRDAIVRQYPPLKERISVVPNPIDTVVMKPALDVPPRAKKETILYVGRVHPEKGVHILVEAFGRLISRYPNLRLHIVGPIAEGHGGGGDSYERTLKSLAQGLPVGFAGPVFEPRSLADIYRGADLFCYPSLAERGEALPVAPLESMACGVPPIVSQLECFNDYICDGENGWLFNHRTERPVDALTDKLDEVLSNQSQISAAGAQASKNARRFSYETVAKEYLTEFANLLDRGSEENGRLKKRIAT